VREVGELGLAFYRAERGRGRGRLRQYEVRSVAGGH
jgi:hypothetical protein